MGLQNDAEDEDIKTGMYSISIYLDLKEAVRLWATIYQTERRYRVMF